MIIIYMYTGVDPEGGTKILYNYTPYKIGTKREN